jgi:hypothetical protein
MRSSALCLAPVLSCLLVAAACGDDASTGGGTGPVTDAGVDGAVDTRVPVLGLLAPACSGSATPTFSWTGPAGATYTLEYGLQGGPATAIDLAAGVTTYAPPSSLAVGTYDWRVRATANGVTSAWSAPSTLLVRVTPPTPSVTVAPICSGQDLALATPTVSGATYAWTGPNGFTSTQQNPIIAGATIAAAGSYRVVITIDGCGSAAGSADASVAAVTSGQFAQTLSAEFATNTNVNVLTTSDRVALPDGLGSGSGGEYHPLADTTIAGGDYEFSSINIPAGVTIKVTGTTPLTLHSTGAVVIDGVLDASGNPGTNGVTSNSAGTAGVGVAGGSNGGDGVYSSSLGPLDGSPGSGPGAGGKGTAWSGGGGAGYATDGNAATTGRGTAGPLYGSADLASFLGGSGGAGGSGGYSCGGGGGGAGGGAVRIASVTIAIGGTLRANGGNGGTDGTGNCGGGGGGSGGAIWLQAGSIANNGTVSATGGTGGASSVSGTPYFGRGGDGAVGRIRVDGPVTGSGTITPASGFSGVSPTAGSSTTAVIQPTNICQWGTLAFTTNASNQGAAKVDVLDGANAVLAAGVANGTSLGSLPAVAASSSIRLRVNLSRSGPGTAELLDWSVGYTQR